MFETFYLLSSVEKFNLTGRIPTRDKNNDSLLKQEKTVGCLKSTCKQFTKQFSFNNNELEIVATTMKLRIILQIYLTVNHVSGFVSNKFEPLNVKPTDWKSAIISQQSAR